MLDGRATLISPSFSAIVSFSRPLATRQDVANPTIRSGGE
ncbi:hypothetical protein [Methylomonas albis]|nr:hypothetical protein [Methylomonas albis]